MSKEIIRFIDRHKVPVSGVVRDLLQRGKVKGASAFIDDSIARAEKDAANVKQVKVLINAELDHEWLNSKPEMTDEELRKEAEELDRELMKEEGVGEEDLNDKAIREELWNNNQ